MFDVIALGPNAVRCLQVKAGTARLSREERAAITAVRLPASRSRDCWRFPDYCREPLIESCDLDVCRVLSQLNTKPPARSRVSAAC